MLTVSNHRPYTYPQGRIDKNPKQKRRTNAATYADWAFGNFIHSPRGKPRFDDPVFVFLGPHAPKTPAPAHVPLHGLPVPPPPSPPRTDPAPPPLSTPLAPPPPT